jgi:hypothetical protein
VFTKTLPAHPDTHIANVKPTSGNNGSTDADH